MPNFVPQNRLYTVAVVVGLIALIALGFANHDPLAGVILGVIVIFFAGPALLVYIMNRRARRREPGGES
jgi:divalent metal cation (Fe/Co/Zn/Cd) transporter